MITAECVPILRDMTSSDKTLLIALAVWAAGNAFAPHGFHVSDSQIRTATGLRRRTLQVARAHLYDLGLIDCAAGSGRNPTWYRLLPRPRRSDTAERMAAATREVLHKGAGTSAPPDGTPACEGAAPPRTSDQMLDTRAAGGAQPPAPPESPPTPPPTAPNPTPLHPTESQGTAAALEARPAPLGPEIVTDIGGTHHVRNLGQSLPRCRKDIGLAHPIPLVNLTHDDIMQLIWCTGCWCESPDVQQRTEEEGR